MPVVSVLMAGRPPAARGVWRDAWHQEEVSERPPCWLCVWTCLESLQSIVFMVTGRLRPSTEQQVLVSSWLGTLPTHFGPETMSVINQAALLVGGTGDVTARA